MQRRAALLGHHCRLECADGNAWHRLADIAKKMTEMPQKIAAYRVRQCTGNACTAARGDIAKAHSPAGACACAGLAQAEGDVAAGHADEHPQGTAHEAVPHAEPEVSAACAASTKVRGLP